MIAIYKPKPKRPYVVLEFTPATGEFVMPPSAPIPFPIVPTAELLRECAEIVNMILKAIADAENKGAPMIPHDPRLSPWALLAAWVIATTISVAISAAVFVGSVYLAVLSLRSLGLL
jgi:hypothetical protein